MRELVGDLVVVAVAQHVVLQDDAAEAGQSHAPGLDRIAAGLHVGLSALLTTTMPAMREVVSAVRETGIPAKILIGGAPVTAEFADDIGADGYAQDAGTAVDIALDLLKTAA